jgi:DNA-binding phage protein
VEQLKSELQDSKEKEKRERLSKAEMQLQSEIDKAIKEGEFDVIETLEAQHSVREYMEEIFDSTGEIPDIKEACKAVTEHIVELTRKIQKSKWLAPKEEKAEAPKETVKIHALSNKMTQTSVSQDRPLTDQERLKAAINAMELVRSK